MLYEKIFVIVLLFNFNVWLTFEQGNNCSVGCSSCNVISSICFSCSAGWEQSSLGYCVNNTKIPSCVMYDIRSNCIACQPTFRLQNNICIKMYDGCLESAQLNLCQKCLPGAILNSDTSTCNINNLNCLQIGTNGRCVQCFPNYGLNSVNNICMYNSTYCTYINGITGLCQKCSPGYVLIGYQCFSQNQTVNLTNCYLFISTNRGVSCQYCKQGYQLQNGLCRLEEDISNFLVQNNCSALQYYNIQNKTCQQVPNYCQMFDYGLLQCVYCTQDRILINGFCRKQTQINCLTFSSINSDLCIACQPKFYLSNQSQCNQFPPFCEDFNNKCVRCIDTFLLNANSQCIDPNCQQIDQSGNCLTCKNNFVKSVEGICQYQDPNCISKINKTCTKCATNYAIDSTSGLCMFVDSNCNITAQGVCIACKNSFYYNIQMSRCMILPSNCLSADNQGRCTQCSSQYALVTTYECMAINQLPNCQIVNQKNQNICQVCISGFYSDTKGVCQALPFFCQQYDAVNNRCFSCTPLGIFNNNGVCIDRNCQYFDYQGVCLGCYQGFEFGKQGQCVIEVNDPNCKQFIYGQCKTCSSGYYFNHQWQCVKVSNLCKSYNQNNGLCTKCYSGYILSSQTEGQCILGTTSSTYIQDYLSTCVTFNSTTNICIQCASGYNLVKTQTNQVICLQQIDPTSSDSQFCTKFDSNNTCIACVPRMYLNFDNICTSIDENCDIFDSILGTCLKCYQGYMINPYLNFSTNHSKECILQNITDPNCKTMNNSKCTQCYSGYYFSNITTRCEILNSLCNTADLKNGNCLSCFSGYVLRNGSCILSTDSSQTNSNNGQSTTNNQVNCLIFSNKNSKYCQQCAWGFVLINGTCFQKDQNCKTFKDTNSLTCLQCYMGYIVFQENQCIDQTKLITNCISYNSNVQCNQCQVGYNLVFDNNIRTHICQAKDPLCMLYNAQTQLCQSCVSGAVLQNSFCIYPLYGFDINCETYQNKFCVKCKTGYKIVGFLCSSS